MNADEFVEKYGNWDDAVLNFKKVCSKHKGVDFQRYSPVAINVATKYVMSGFDPVMAFRYAVNYGMDGLFLIKDLEDDFAIRLPLK